MTEEYLEQLRELLKRGCTLRNQIISRVGEDKWWYHRCGPMVSIILPDGNAVEFLRTSERERAAAISYALDETTVKNQFGRLEHG